MTTIRRVPLDFDWPLNEGWHGYLKPTDLRLPPCESCRYNGYDSTGLSPAAYAIEATFYALDVADPWRSQYAWHDKITQPEVDMLVKEGRLPVWEVDAGTGRGGWNFSAPRTAAEVNAAQHVPGLFGHDALNRWRLVQYRCEALGIDMICPICQGKTHVGTAEQVATSEAWEPFDPPTGEGWQVWEDVSEGSPISPVFDSAAALIDWLTSPDSGHAYSRFPLTREQAEALVDAGGSIGSAIGVATPGGAMLVDGDRAPHYLSLTAAATATSPEGACDES